MSLNETPAPFTRAPGFAHRMRWVAILYFIEGLPFGIIWDLWPVYFRTRHVSLKDIGLISLFGLAYTAKPLWAPLVDRFGDRRVWISACLAAMAALLALQTSFGTGAPSLPALVVLMAFALASATQDIAIDGHTIAFLETGEEGAANGIRVGAYRAALVTAGGGFMALAGLAGWRAVFVLGAAAFAVLALVARRAPAAELSAVERKRFLKPFAEWIARPASLWALLFILLYKVGDSAIGLMTKTFWIDRGLTPEEIGLISITLGAAMSVLGALAGGWFTTRWGLMRGLLVMGIAQVLPNLGYAAVSALHLGRASIYSVSLLESFGQGLGTAAFLSLLMRLCDREHAGTQYALLSALFSLSRQVAGAAGGWAAQTLGYTAFFGYTFLLGLPALLLLPAVARRVEAARRSA